MEIRRRETFETLEPPLALPGSAKISCLLHRQSSRAELQDEAAPFRSSVFSSVARVAVQQLLNVVLLNQLGPQRLLRLRRDVMQIEYLAPWTDKPFGISMTIQTPFHVQRVALVSNFHLVDRPVASGAADALVHMNAVIEVDEVRQVVQPRPRNAFVCPVTGAYGLEHRAVHPDLRVATHAGMRGKHAREVALLHRGVAVPAINAELTDVVLVTEWHRLPSGQANSRDVGRANYRRKYRKTARDR